MNQFQLPLLLLGSARKSSDTGKLVEHLAVKIPLLTVDLLDYQVFPFSYEGDYPASDQFRELTKLLISHQQIIFATPVYWYSMSGIMKTLFDRFTDLVTIHKTSGRALSGKKTYLMAVGAEDSLPDGFEVPFLRTSQYLDMDYQGSCYFKNGDGVNLEKKMAVFSEMIVAGQGRILK